MNSPGFVRMREDRWLNLSVVPEVSKQPDGLFVGLFVCIDFMV